MSWSTTSHHAPMPPGMTSVGAMLSDDDVEEFHDENALHGKVATYTFRVRAHDEATFNRHLNGKLINVESEENPERVLVPIRSTILAFQRKMADSLKNKSKASRIVYKICSADVCKRICKEEDSTDHQVYFFFCGGVVYELETRYHVDYAPVWKFEDDRGKMIGLAKDFSVKLERAYQKAGGTGVLSSIIGPVGRMYSYNFDEMTQTNTKTNKKRRITRDPRLPSVASGEGAAMSSSSAVAAAASGDNAGSSSAKKTAATIVRSTGVLSKQHDVLLPPWLNDLSKPEHGSIPMDILVTLHKQRIDETTFLLLSSEDLASLGIPLGPRLALLKVVRDRKLLTPTMTAPTPNNNNDDKSPVVVVDRAAAPQFPAAAAASSADHDDDDVKNKRGVSPNSSSGGGNPNNSSACSPSTCSERDEREIALRDFMSMLSENFHRTLVIDPSDVEIFNDSPLGHGGYGLVFEAAIGELGKPVAAKVFDRVADGLDESLRCAGLFHKNVVSLVGVTAYLPRRSRANRPFSPSHPAAASSSPSQTQSPSFSFCPKPKLVMLLELAEGTLTTVLAQRAPTLDFDYVMRVVLQIANGLEYLHSRQPRLLHLDLKPSNLLCFSDGLTIKITDFGISRLTLNTSTSVTACGRATPVYCAPEQFLSNTVSTTNDTYSFGVVLWYFITGLNPADVVLSSSPVVGSGGGSEQQQQQQQQQYHRLPPSPQQMPQLLLDALKPREGCPEYLVDICKVCLNSDPALRPKDGSTLVRLLESKSAQDYEDNMLVRGFVSSSVTTSTRSGSDVVVAAQQAGGGPQEETAATTMGEHNNENPPTAYYQGVPLTM